MQINIRNNARLPNKYVRFIKWKFFRIKEKFDDLIYVEVFLNTEGTKPKIFSTTMRLGIPGNDVILHHKSDDPGKLFQKSYQAVHRYLAKNKMLKMKS